MNMNIPGTLPSNTNSHHSFSLSIRGRLWLGFFIIIVTLLVMVSITLNIIVTTKKITEQTLQIDLPSYDNAFNLGMAIYNTDSKIHKWLLSNNSDIKKEADASFSYIFPLQQNIDHLSNKWINTTAINYWKMLKGTLIELQQLQKKILSFNYNDAIKNKVDLIQLDKLSEKALDLLNGYNLPNGQNVNGISDFHYKQVTMGAGEIINGMNNIQLTVYISTVIAILVSIIVALFTIKSILRHINVFRKHSSRIASGDLREHILLDSNDEIGQLGNDLNNMTDSLSNVTKLIIQACHNVVSTLEEVKQAVDMQSTGATEQASSITEITASLEEIEKSSSQTMEKAKELGTVAERTREKGQLGLDAVEQSILGMKAVRDKVQLIAQTIQELSNQTQQISEITTVVNTLAQQSKMLALNASIEAAKAGEAGKGFSVVASEVKNLAEQSEQSTTQVQKILEDIRRATEKAVMVTEEGTKGVDHGTELVEQTGDIVRSLSDVIHEATIASQQIEAAIRQEGAGIEQITSGMNEINQVTLSFVSSVKQTTEAITNLATIAKNLKEQVDTYKI